MNDDNDVPWLVSDFAWAAIIVAFCVAGALGICT